LGTLEPTFQFQLRAPGVPLDLKLVPGEAGTLVLAWKPNPGGEPPVAYKVYGSDEKGFTACDTEHLVNRGKGFVPTMEEYENKSHDAPHAGMIKTASNLIARVADTSLPTVGPELDHPNTNTAFYRVVAIAEGGHCSGPSDYAEVPRPFVVTQPRQTAKRGQPYHHQLRVIRSIGDLRCRPSNRSSYNAAFWDREVHTFTATSLPPGLSLDTKTGVVKGEPQRAGTFDVAVDVTDQIDKRCQACYQLIVEE